MGSKPFWSPIALLVSRPEYPRDKPFLLTMVSYLEKSKKIKMQKRKKNLLIFIYFLDMKPLSVELACLLGIQNKIQVKQCSVLYLFHHMSTINSEFSNYIFCQDFFLQGRRFQLRLNKKTDIGKCLFWISKNLIGSPLEKKILWKKIVDSEFMIGCWHVINKLVLISFFCFFWKPTMNERIISIGTFNFGGHTLITLKFIYSEKATKFWEIFTLLLIDTALHWHYIGQK